MTNSTQPSQQVPVAMTKAQRKAEIPLFCQAMRDRLSKNDLGKLDTDADTMLGHEDMFEGWCLAKSLIAPDAGLAEDAKRYRWIKANGMYKNVPNLDERIDACLASQEPQHG